MKITMMMIALIEAAIIALLCSLLAERSFNNANMAYAYRSGCQVSAAMSRNYKVMAKCYDISQEYEKTLDYLDQQMEKIETEKSISEKIFDTWQ